MLFAMKDPHLKDPHLRKLVTSLETASERYLPAEMGMGFATWLEYVVRTIETAPGVAVGRPDWDPLDRPDGGDSVAAAELDVFRSIVLALAGLTVAAAAELTWKLQNLPHIYVDGAKLWVCARGNAKGKAARQNRRVRR